MSAYDLVVLGSGPAGEKGAVQAAWFGKKVALVEKAPWPGGAAANTGTLPSKTLRETALYLSGFRQRGLHGCDLKLERSVTLDDFLHHAARVTAAERARIDENLQRHGVHRYQGEGSFLSPHQIRVKAEKGGQVLEAKHVLIATGSTPHRPPEFPFDHQRVYDSDEMVAVHTLPERMAVIGGGVIGCEYACLFAALGVQVTLVETKPCVLGFLDAELVARLTAELVRLGVVVRTSTCVKLVDVDERSVRLGFDVGEPWQGDIVLVAAGRQASTSALNLEAAGLVAGKRGQLTVDARYRTSVPHIAAAGDVIGFPALASTSMEQARVAVVHLFGESYKPTLAPVLPYGLYTIPEVSMAGETEASCREKGVPFVVGRAEFRDNARGWIIGERAGLLKLVVGLDGALLGVHVLGEGATELVHVGLTALMTKSPVQLFIETCFNYPTLSEAYKYAAYDALGKLAAATAAPTRP